MAEVHSDKTNASEEFNEDDLDEDEHLYQFTINFGGANTAGSAAASELDQYTSSDEEGNNRQKKSVRLRKSKDASRSDVASARTGTAVQVKVAAEQSAPVSITCDEAQQEQEVVSEVMNYAKAVSLVDWGSIAHIKHGTAGESADKDRFPFFNPTLKHWIYLAWDDHPKEWVFLLLDKRQDEYEGDFEQVPSENKIFLRDITEVYLELAPSVSFRVYLSAQEENQVVFVGDGGDGGGIDYDAVAEDGAATATVAGSENASTTAQGTSKAPVVLKITPVPNVRGHAAMWVDALFAAMQLQCFEPEEEVLEVKSRYYEALQARNYAVAGDDVIVLDEGRQSSVNLGSDESTGSVGDLEKGRKRPVSGRVEYADVYGSGAKGRGDAQGAKDPKSCCAVC